MNYLFMLLLAVGIVGLSGAATVRREPPCKCEVTFHKKKRKGMLPCIVGILRDSASQKPLEVAAVVVNDNVIRTGKEGRVYCEVLPDKKVTLVAKCFTYYFCTQKVVAHEGDSIVCIFNMRRVREWSDGPEDNMRPSFFRRLSTWLKR